MWLDQISLSCFLIEILVVHRHHRLLLLLLLPHSLILPAGLRRGHRFSVQNLRLVEFDFAALERLLDRYAVHHTSGGISAEIFSGVALMALFGVHGGVSLGLDAAVADIEVLVLAYDSEVIYLRFLSTWLNSNRIFNIFLRRLPRHRTIMPLSQESKIRVILVTPRLLTNLPLRSIHLKRLHFDLLMRFHRPLLPLLLLFLRRLVYSPYQFGFLIAVWNDVRLFGRRRHCRLPSF